MPHRQSSQSLDFLLSALSHPICFRPAPHAAFQTYSATPHGRGNAVPIGNAPYRSDIASKLK